MVCGVRGGGSLCLMRSADSAHLRHEDSLNFKASFFIAGRLFSADHPFWTKCGRLCLFIISFPREVGVHWMEYIQPAAHWAFWWFLALFHSFSSGCCVGFSRFCCASLKRRLPDSGGSAITFAISLFKLCARRIQTKTKDLWSLGDHLINIFHRSRKFFVVEQVHAQSFNSWRF